MTYRYKLVTDKFSEQLSTSAKTGDMFFPSRHIAFKNCLRRLFSVGASMTVLQINAIVAP